MESKLTAVAVILQNEKLLTLLEGDPTKGQQVQFLPGGEIESHETAPEAVENRTFEKTGYSIEVDPLASIDKEYDFFWNKTHYSCLTLFYLGRLKSPFRKQVNTPVGDPLSKILWLPFDQIENTMKGQVEVLEAIWFLIQKSKGN